MTLILSETLHRVATITLNRPETLNAFGGTMREELVAALDAAAADPEVRCIVLTGAGRAFCSGGDVDAMRRMQQEGDAAAFRGTLEAGRSVVARIRAMPKLVVAMVNGVAAGAGCNLALACDYRIAASDARLGETFIRIGLHPDWGGTWFLPRLVGPSRALEMMVTGRMVSADEAFTLGMIDRVVPADRLREETTAFAGAIASGPPGTIAAIKKALHASAGNDLDAQLAIEIQHQLAAFASDEANEGVAAFVEKRQPRF
ncbi:MAG TPA: enoyl-CoA hydratase-related protein [Thermoanaerobaculia bacterium]